MPSNNNDIAIKARLDYTEFKKGMKEINSEYSKQKTFVNALEAQIKSTFDVNNPRQFDKAIVENEKTITKLNQKLDMSVKELDDMKTAGKDNTKEFTDLQIQITKMETELVNANKRQEKFNQNVKAIEDGKLENLTNDYKKIAKNTGQATDEELQFNKSLKQTAKEANDMNAELNGGQLDEYTASLEEGKQGGFDMSSALETLTSESELANSAVEIGTKLINPYTLVIGGAVLALNQWAESEQRVSEAVKASAGTNVSAITTTKGYTRQVQNLANAYGIEYSDALDISIKQQNLFNTTVLDGAKGQNDFNKTMALTNLEYIDYEGAVTAINKAQSIGNESTDKMIGLLFNANAIMGKYGASADDLLDTFSEFGQYYGSFEGFLKTSNFALEAGVKDLGSFNDGINEFNTVIRESSTSYQKSMNEIQGATDDLTSNKEFQKYIDTTYNSIVDGSKTTSQAFAELIVKLADFKDSTKADAVAISLFGDTALEQSKQMIEFEKRTGEVSYALDQQAKKATEAKNRNKALADILNVSSQTMTTYNQVVNGSTKGYKAMAEGLGLNQVQANKFTSELQKGLPYAQDYLEEIGVGTPMIGAFSEAFRNGDQALATWGMKVYQGQQVTALFTNKLGLSAEQSKQFSLALSQGLPSVLSWLNANNLTAQAQGLLAQKTGLTKKQVGALTQAMLLNQEGHKGQALAIANENGLLDILKNKNLISAETYRKLTTQVNNQKSAVANLKLSMSNLSAENGLLNKSTSELKNQFGLTRRSAGALNTDFKLLKSSTTSLEEKSRALTNAIEKVHPELDLNRASSKGLSSALATAGDKSLTLDKRTEGLKSALEILKNNGFKPSKKEADFYNKTMSTLDTSTSDSADSLYDQANSAVDAKKGLSDAESVASDSQTTFQNLKSDVYNLSDSYNDLSSSASNAASSMSDAKDAKPSGSKSGGFSGLFSAPIPQAPNVSRETSTPTNYTSNHNRKQSINNSKSITINNLTIDAKDNTFDDMNSFINFLNEEIALRT